MLTVLINLLSIFGAVLSYCNSGLQGLTTDLTKTSMQAKACKNSRFFAVQVLTTCSREKGQQERTYSL